MYDKNPRELKIMAKGGVMKTYDDFGKERLLIKWIESHLKVCQKKIIFCNKKRYVEGLSKKLSDVLAKKFLKIPKSMAKHIVLPKQKKLEIK